MQTLTRQALQIIDPGHRLPQDYKIPQEANGFLYLPNNGAPIHPLSLDRLIQEGMAANQPACFTPTVPVSSELGLPKYPPIAFWSPSHLVCSPRNLWHMVKKASQGTLVSDIQMFERSVSKNNFSYLDIQTTSKEEQSFYFVDHFKYVSPVPLQVCVIVSNSCNLKCVMCPYHSPDIRPTHTTDFFTESRFMSWETMERIAEECGQNNIIVKIGNIEEPLLHPQLIDFIKLCVQKGVNWVHMTSNGLLLNEENSRKLLEAGITSLYVSIDAADPETYKRIRGAKLEKVDENVRTFLRLKKEMNKNCRVMVSIIRNEGVTEEEEKAFCDKWLPHLDGVIIQNLVLYEAGNTKPTFINDLTTKFMDKVGGRWPCLNPWQEVYLLPDGRIYYCCETVSKLAFDNLQSMGDYNTHSVVDIWHGEHFAQLRRDLLYNNLDQQTACQDCGIWMAHVVGYVEKNGYKVMTNMLSETVYPQNAQSN